MVGTVLLLGLPAALAFPSLNATATFNTFVKTYGKSYTQEEASVRLLVFASNLELVEKRNAENVAAGGKPVHGVTKFMDLTPEEFKAQYLNAKPPVLEGERSKLELNGPAADEVDWRLKGALTPVKDQGKCGSCWAHAATESVESMAFLTGGHDLMELSVQQMTSCTLFGLFGCGGGQMDAGLDYAWLVGLETAEDYPYTSGSGDTGKCTSDKSKVVVKTAGKKDVSRGEANLEAALNIGPPSIGVAAEAWQTYTGGVLTVCDGRMDHGVQAVGYTADTWIVRNSWGTDWGESGFINVARGSNLCGISDSVSYAHF